MNGLGEELRRTREERGITLERAEEETKIRRKYLECLEQERFAELPGRVYSIGFLRSYARYLGLDGDALVARLKERMGEQPEEPGEPVLLVGTRRGWRGVLWLLLALLVLLAAGLYWGVGRDRAPESGAQPPGAALPGEGVTPPAGGRQGEAGGANPPPVEKAGEGTVARPAAQEVRLRLAVEQAPSWMEVRVDGKLVFSGTLRPGDSREFTGRERVHLYVGNAGAVRVTVNGREMGLLGRPGGVVRRSFTPAGEEASPGEAAAR